jgi:hypothetical protein
MKKRLVIGFSVALTALAGVARAADAPTKQEGRVWLDTNMLLVLSPNWSLTVMPGARGEFARSREGKAGLHFLELFFGPNYTYKTGNFTIKGSLWYYYMGYPQRGRDTESPATVCSGLIDNQKGGVYCGSLYNFSHNIEIIPSIEYRFGRWSLFDRVILHNTFYADYYSTPAGTKSISDQRWGWGTVLRELLQIRYALNDRAGVFASDEIFLGMIEDGDTRGIANNGGYSPLGYWKRGLRYNRTYLGFDYKVTPNLTVAPSYMIEIGLNRTDSTDITDIAHTLFIVTTISASVFEPKK